MKEEDKEKGQLISELAELRQRAAVLEASETKHKRTEDELQRRLKELSSLHDISTIVTSSFDLEHILGEVFTNAVTVLEAETGSLMTLDEKHQSLTIKASRGLKKEVISRTRVRLGKGICGWVAQSGQPVLLKNRVTDPRFKPIVRKPQIKHAICAPLKYKEKIMGVINLNRESSARPFTEEDLRLLSTVAYEIAAAIQNIKLYNELRTTITELEQANKEIKQAQASLIQSEKLASLGKLAAGMAHELNNPLGAVSGRAQLLLMDMDKDKDLQAIKNLWTIVEQTTRASKIVGNLLQFAREAKQEVEPVDINPVIEKSISLTRHQISLENVELSMELKPDLPRIMGDQNQLQQVFVNLITNAWEAMPDGGKLTISTGLLQESLLIKVTDTGHGIPKENLGKLFDPFFTTRETGTGLGLSIIHGIIEAHNGTIKAQSHLGQGSTFTVKFPVIKQES